MGQPGERPFFAKVLDRFTWWLLGSTERFDFWQRRGYHVQRINFYESLPDTRDLPEHLWDGPRALVGIDLDVDGQLQRLESFRQFADELGGVPSGDSFLPGDAEALYCMVRDLRPKRIIEIGSGVSTHVIDLAVAANGADSCHHTVIDPRPAPAIRTIASVSELRIERVQDVELAAFEALEAGDILFIDSTHVVATGSDVVFELLEVLPRLRPGVVVHLHDIFLPYEYPRSWLLDQHLFWTEQYLAAALLTGNPSYGVLWASQYLYRQHREALIDVIPSIAGVDPDPNAKGGPASFWLVRI